MMRLNGNTRDLVNGTSDKVKPLKTMANVRRVSYAKPLVVLGPPKNLYEEVNNMNYRHSSPAVSFQPEVGPIYVDGQRSGSIYCPELVNKETPESKRSLKFQARIGDSIVSTASLIMASSTTVNAAAFVEKKIVNGSSSMEDLWIKNQEYQFENLVFEGGGSKGMAYVGALQVILN